MAQFQSVCASLHTCTWGVEGEGGAGETGSAGVA